MDRKRRERELVIPNYALNERIRNVTVNVKFQRLGRLGGLIFYPSVSGISYLASHSKEQMISLLLCLPFCFSVHFLGVRAATETAGEIVREGEIISQWYERPEWRLENLRKNFTHFYINQKGDLVFVNEPRQGFFKKFFQKKRIALQEKDSKDSKIRNFVRRLIQNSIFETNKIPYHHLDPQVREQIDKIVQSRSKRFRKVMGLTLIAPIVRSITGGKNDIVDLLVSAHIGAVVGLIVSGNEPGYQTEKLWEILDKFRSPNQIIDEKYRKKYDLIKSKKEKPYMKVTLFGNVKLVKQPWFAFRKTHRY